SVGQYVFKNQPLTKNDDISQPIIHAPTSGVIVAIESHPIVHAVHQNVPCIVIAADGKDMSCALTPSIWQTESISTLKQICHDAGIVGLGGAGFPSMQKLAETAIDTLI